MMELIVGANVRSRKEGHAALGYDDVMPHVR